MRNFNLVIIILIFFLNYLILNCSSTKCSSKTFIATKDVGPLDNPLKGWVAYSEPGDTHSLTTKMAYFYFSWRDIEPSEGVYNFTTFENRWQSSAATGKHIVFRLYLDYPNSPTGIPQWIINKGIQLTRYETQEVGNGYSPDYNDERLLQPLLKTISKLGQRYNNNNRVAFIAIGTLGFWGEWHTWPLEHLFANATTQQRVVNAYRAAFPNKILLTRYPGGETGKQNWIGYHDDYFPDDTNATGWGFIPTMKESGRLQNWRKAAIGAEMVPNAANTYLFNKWDQTMSMLRAIHLTWMGPYCPAIEFNKNSTFYDRARLMVRTMGYQYEFNHIQLSCLSDGKLSIALRAINTGVAPFYYNWIVRFAFFRSSDKLLIKQFNTAVDIRNWLPGTFWLNTTITPQLNPGTFSLAIGIIDPWTQKPAITFANKFTRIERWSILANLTFTQ
eukprot:TRINITY_DN958_c0_g1_i1.p1 TRINITY_DN958_c0_g1~~TRINITY_DN958_c0_g1_i1.p1  ORF type:complete len:445 (-),score=229.34 TRINITY_DN958_c0_g1_i1:159-1493(-)